MNLNEERGYKRHYWNKWGSLGVQILSMYEVIVLGDNSIMGHEGEYFCAWEIHVQVFRATGS